MDNYKSTIAHPSETFGNVHPNEYEQASNSYIMSLVSVMVGTFIPIVNLVAAIIFYLGSRKSSYFIRWHAIQSALGQAVLIPVNSIAFSWTLKILFTNFDHHYGSDESFFIENFSEASPYYWIFTGIVLLLNLFEFIVTIHAASQVRKGHNVRWFVLANITDSICSKENRDPYRL